MIKCNFCGEEKADGRTMHGHMMRWHYDKYKEINFDLEKAASGFKRTNSNQKRKEMKEMKKDNLKNNKPINLRLLNKKQPDEFAAYNEGYRYLDPDDMIAYTAEEVKEEGWI